MATRPPKPKTLEEAETMIILAKQAKAELEEQGRKDDAHRKIIVGGAWYALLKDDPAYALSVMKRLELQITKAAHRKAIAGVLPDGESWPGIFAAAKSRTDRPKKTGTPEALHGEKISDDRAAKTLSSEALAAEKSTADSAEKPAPIARPSTENFWDGGLENDPGSALLPAKNQDTPEARKPMQVGPLGGSLAPQPRREKPAADGLPAARSGPAHINLFSGVEAHPQTAGGPEQ